MAKTTIPEDIKSKVQNIIRDFNKKVFLNNPEWSYYAIYRGKFLYLNRKEGENDSPIARLKFNGSMSTWDFAIFKWSRERYDPDEFFFPGSKYLNGTIEGALKAAQEAYPPSNFPSETEIFNFMEKFLDKFKKMNK